MVCSEERMRCIHVTGNAGVGKSTLREFLRRLEGEAARAEAEIK